MNAIEKLIQELPEESKKLAREIFQAGGGYPFTDEQDRTWINQWEYVDLDEERGSWYE